MTSIHHVSDMIYRPVIYFAHPVNVYGTQEQERCLALIRYYFPQYHVENPDSNEHEIAYRQYKEAGRSGMDHFVAFIRRAVQAVVFLPLSDGMISAGVALEIETAHMDGLPLWEIVPAIPSWYIRSVVFDAPLTGRFLTQEETRRRLNLTEELSIKG